MKRFFGFLLFICILHSSSVLAQFSGHVMKDQPYKWMFGLHWSIVDDDGDAFGKLLNAGSSWNLRPYPTKLTVDRYLKQGWSLETALTYGQYMPKNIINGQVGLSGIMGAVDIHGKYSFSRLYAPSAKWIEPYIIFGGGYTIRTVSTPAQTPTANIGGGLNFWIIDELGIQLASSAKFAFLPTFWKTSGNYLQHSFGIVYRPSGEKKTRHRKDKKRYPWTTDKKRIKGKLDSDQ
jgi:OmpA-OmpF porin, OOP family